jgi:hypothetical protein
MSNIKWKFNDGDIMFISPADKFDEHVRKFAVKFGLSKNNITILENGTDSTHSDSSSGDTASAESTDLPKRTRNRTSKSQTDDLRNMSDVLGESDSTPDSLVDPASDSGDSESGSVSGS